jgi:hypothetical protein
MSASNPVNPFRDVSDEQLLQLQLALALACGRSHQSLTRKRQNWFCLLGRILKIETDFRGLPTPPPPYHASNLDPLAL